MVQERRKTGGQKETPIKMNQKILKNKGTTWNKAQKLVQNKNEPVHS